MRAGKRAFYADGAICITTQRYAAGHILFQTHTHTHTCTLHRPFK